MNKLLLIIAFLTTFAFAEQIQNIQVAQRTDGSGIVDITYDLIDNNFPSFTVLVEISIDEGEFTSYDLTLLSGDVGENVIPGIGKSIQLQAPADLYSSNVVVKIIASAYMVTSELPFTMIGISSSQGVSSYQGQSIDYNFEIMQSELTNADLVTFLETYEFQLNEDEAPIYDCNQFKEYFYTPTDEWITGCMDSEALNYNPNANEDPNNSCIFPNQAGCSNQNALNYNNSEEIIYNDCSCSKIYVHVPYTGPYDPYPLTYNEDCTFHELQDIDPLDEDHVEITTPAGNSLHFEIGYENLISVCTDPGALNYYEESVNWVNSLISQVPDGCLSITDQENVGAGSACQYECNDFDMYLGDFTYDGSQDYGNVNIEDFSTQSISFEGSSFVIESGAGTKPALLNYNNCVDGIIVSLLLDYYGLRIPNGEEWMKASRQDNDRCWPWMSETCQVSKQNYCESLFTCQSEEEFDACIENAEALQLNCQQNCNAQILECDNACDSNDNFSNNCSSLQNEFDCDQNSNCDWQSESCMDVCTACINEGDYWDICGTNPTNVACPCSEECTFDNNNNECFSECSEINFSCMNECGNNYGNSHEYCNHQELMDCENNLYNCINSDDRCEEIESDILSEIIDGTGSNESNYDENGFLSYIYSNKFNFIYELNNDSNSILNVQDVAQYPEGISPFGLYDVIGNAPELVKFNNKYWLIGLHADQDRARSFCTNSAFDEYGDSQGQPIEQTNSKKYGLRLIRTTTGE